MYEEYRGKGVSPASIVKDLREHRIDDDEAIKRIEYCMYEAIQNESPLDKDDMKRIKTYIAEVLWDRWNVPAKGNSDTINDTLKEALKKLGQGSDFYKIKRKYYGELEDIIYRIG